MKKYTINNLNTCKKKVFGHINFYDKYVLTDDFYIKGINKKNPEYIYMEVDEYTLVKDVKKIGRILFEKFHSSIEPIIIKEENYYCLSNNFLSNNILNNNKDFIFNNILSFLNKYGIPIDFNSFSSETKTKFTEQILLEILCYYFIRLHIISSLAFHYNKGILINKMYNVLSISSENICNKNINDFFNLDLKNFNDDRLNKFEFKIEENYAIYKTNNLFSFAFERLYLNIIERKVENNKFIRYCKCGKVITNENKTNKNSRAKIMCDSCFEEYQKKCNRKKANDSYKKISKIYKNFKMLVKFLKKENKNGFYDNILNQAYNIKTRKDFKITKYIGLYKQLSREYNKLKKCK